MALSEHPTTAENIISFSGQKGRAAIINYSVPLPSSHAGRRIQQLEGLGLQEDDWTDAAKDAGAGAAQKIGLAKVAEGQYTFDQGTAISWWLESAKAAGLPGDQLAELGRWQASAVARRNLAPRARAFGGLEPEGEVLNPQPGAAAGPLPGGRVGLTPNPDPTGPGPEIPALWPQVETFLDRLRRGIIEKPGRAWGDTPESREIPADLPQVQPALFLIEVYSISSFLGDYGLGRTVKTFTLFPGEHMKISTKTWRTSTESYKASSSIVDSFNQSSADRFRGQVQRETTDKRTRASNEYWHAEAEVDATWGWGSAEVTGGGGGQYQSGREEFARTLSDTVQEHTQEASSKRDTTVTSSSETSVTQGEEETTERTIHNVNLRHVLNFVFRELNQSYVTKIHLRDVRIGFTNGGINTWREVPLSGLRTLLQEVVVAGKVGEVAQRILKLVAVVFDTEDEPVPVLETFRMSADGLSWTQEEAALDPATNEFPAPGADFFYRFKRGPLGQDPDDPNPVDGVLMKRTEVSLRTDSLVVEALLGQADALDEYAMMAQKADAEARVIANERARIVNQGLAAIADGKERATVYAEIVRTNGAVRLEIDRENGGT